MLAVLNPVKLDGTLRIRVVLQTSWGSSALLKYPAEGGGGGSGGRGAAVMGCFYSNRKLSPTIRLGAVCSCCATDSTILKIHHPKKICPLSRPPVKNLPLSTSKKFPPLFKILDTPLATTSHPIASCEPTRPPSSTGRQLIEWHCFPPLV